MTNLDFSTKITAGVYRAVITNNRKYAYIQNVGVLPQAAFDLLHKNHDTGGVSNNFLLFDKKGDYEVCKLPQDIALIKKNTLAEE